MKNRTKHTYHLAYWKRDASERGLFQITAYDERDAQGIFHRLYPKKHYDVVYVNRIA